jgi:2-ketoarginine methyltransferase
MQAWGIEPSLDGYMASVQAMKECGLEDRVHLQNVTAQEFVEQTDIADPDLVVLGFVLHEILGADGEAGVQDFLLSLTRRFPSMAIIVIEVDHQPRNPTIMRHDLARAYYNPYYLFHHFTNQRLEDGEYWRGLFSRLGFAIHAEETTDPRMDSTGLELGFLLRSGADSLK